MRIFYFRAGNKLSPQKPLKIFKKIIFIVLVACWGFFGVCQVASCTVKKYVYPLTYKEQITNYSKEFSLNPHLIFAVVKVESSFNKNAVSSKGAKGLMQITEPTASFIASMLGEINYDLFDVATNVRFGTKYISYLLNKFNSLDTAIVAYNAGEGNVARWLSSEKYSKDGITLNTVPFPESREYLIKIKKTFEKYEKIYGNIVDKP